MEHDTFLSTQNGEYEDSNFWQNNEALIQEALLELGPLRSYVYAPQKLADVFQPAVVAALEVSYIYTELWIDTRYIEQCTLHSWGLNCGDEIWVMIVLESSICRSRRPLTRSRHS